METYHKKKVGEKLKEYLEYLANYQHYLSVYRSGKYPPTHTHLTEGHRQRVRVENTKGEKNLKGQQFIKEIISLNWNFQNGGSLI